MTIDKKKLTRFNAATSAEKLNVEFVQARIAEWSSVDPESLNNAERETVAKWKDQLKVALNHEARKEAKESGIQDNEPNTFANDLENYTILYYQRSKESNDVVSVKFTNFLIRVISKRIPIEEPTRIMYELEFNNGILPTPRIVTVRDEHMSSKERFASNYCGTDYSLFGSTQQLLEYSSQVLRTANVPLTYSTTRIGIQRHPVSKKYVYVDYDRTFDANNNTIEDFRFDGQHDVNNSFKSNIVPSSSIPKESAEKLKKLIFNFNSKKIATGFVGFLAACFFKPQIIESGEGFPMLTLIGVSGAGKTQTATHIVNGFFDIPYRAPINFYTCTRFARNMRNSASTSYPAIWDEVKPSNDYMREEFKSLVNVAYNNSFLERGTIDGVNGLGTRSFQMTTPCIFTGEQKIGDVSTFERLVVLDFSKDASCLHTAEFEELTSSGCLAHLGAAMLHAALSLDEVLPAIIRLEKLINGHLNSRPRRNAAIVLFGACIVASLLNMEVTEEELAEAVNAIFIDEETGKVHRVETEPEKILNALDQMRIISKEGFEEKRVDKNQNVYQTINHEPQYLWRNNLIEGIHYKVCDDGIAYHMPTCWPRIKAWFQESKSETLYQSSNDFITQVKTHSRFVKSNRPERLADGKLRKCIILKDAEDEAVSEFFN